MCGSYLRLCGAVGIGDNEMLFNASTGTIIHLDAAMEHLLKQHVAAEERHAAVVYSVKIPLGQGGTIGKLRS